jgi:hypothetical protein
MIGKGKPKHSKKNLSQCQSAHHKSQLIVLGLKSALRSEQPAAKCLNYDTTKLEIPYWPPKSTNRPCPETIITVPDTRN